MKTNITKTEFLYPFVKSNNFMFVQMNNDEFEKISNYENMSEFIKSINDLHELTLNDSINGKRLLMFRLYCNKPFNGKVIIYHSLFLNNIDITNLDLLGLFICNNELSMTEINNIVNSEEMSCIIDKVLDDCVLI